MIIEDIISVNDMLNEKQLQPAQGSTEGNILFVGGSPGSGKNWVLKNLTDVPQRYKIFDIDEILEYAAKFEAPKFKQSFRKYILNNHDDVLGKRLVEILDTDGIFYFIKTTNTSMNELLYSFLHNSGLAKGKQLSFFLSILDGVKPNICFNGTMRYTPSIISDIKILEEIGYDVKGKIDFLYVISTTEFAIQNANKRSTEQRRVDTEFVVNARKKSVENIVNLLDGVSELSPYMRNTYIVFNSPDNASYYPGTSLVKDFKYMKITKNDTDKIENFKQSLKDTYA